jgi:WD40 repeat protein
VAAAPDSRHAVSAADDKTLRIWDLESGQLVRALKGVTARILQVANDAEGLRLVSTPGDNTINVWNVKTVKGT